MARARQGPSGSRSRLLIALAMGAAIAAGCVQPRSSGSSAPGSNPASSTTGAPAPGSSAALAPSGAIGAGLPLLVDTDMAPDDVTAIASLLRDPAVDLQAITVSGTGEAHCPGGMFVARAIVTMLVDRHVPVACGNASPLADAEEFPVAWRAAADSGNGLDLVSPSYVPDDRSASEVIVELASAAAATGGRLTILTLGPLTNVAVAQAADPGLPAKVRLVSMLGAIDVPGNVTTQPGSPTAEWNAHADPTAVRRVLEGGFDWTLVPLDATADTPITPELFADLGADHRAGPADLVFELWARNPYMYAGGFYLWDPLASVVVRDASVVTTDRVRLLVTEGDGLDGGRLREDPAGVEVSVARTADRVRFEATLLERLRIGGPRANSFSTVGSLHVDGDAERCQASLDPATPPAGLLEVGVSNRGAEPLNVVVFELAGLSWLQVKAFVAAYDPTAPPPPVTILSQLGAPPGGEASGYASSPAGSIGVACFSGSLDDPTILLAGPYAIGP